MLKPLVHKFHSDLSFRLKDITEKQVPAKMKPIVGELDNSFRSGFTGQSLRKRTEKRVSWL